LLLVLHLFRLVYDSLLRFVLLRQGPHSHQV
jgi:hypothetical protein